MTYRGTEEREQDPAWKRYYLETKKRDTHDRQVFETELLQIYGERLKDIITQITMSSKGILYGLDIKSNSYTNLKKQIFVPIYPTKETDLYEFILEMIRSSEDELIAINEIKIRDVTINPTEYYELKEIFSESVQKLKTFFVDITYYLVEQIVTMTSDLNLYLSEQFSINDDKNINSIYEINEDKPSYNTLKNRLQDILDYYKKIKENFRSSLISIGQETIGDERSETILEHDHIIVKHAEKLEQIIALL